MNYTNYIRDTSFILKKKKMKTIKMFIETRLDSCNQMPRQPPHEKRLH